MKTSFWRRWVNSLRGTRPTGRVSRARPRRQLFLEALEDRVTPSLTPLMVLDINPGDASSNPSLVVAIGSTTYFAADDGVHGVELWKSDGTAAGTVLVKDINPGSGPSQPLWLTNVNGTLFFRAWDGTYGWELWKSDGTAAGTTLVKDMYSGALGSYPYSLTNVNGTLFFTPRNVDGTGSSELWKSDGTAAGTTLVKDIYPGTSRVYDYYYGYREVLNTSSPSNLTDVNGTLFFTAYDGTNGTNARELWKSDGTEAGTTLVKDIYPGSRLSYDHYRGYYDVPNGSSPGNLTNVNGTLFFTAEDGTNGRELWKSDGTAAGTVLLKDIYPGWSSYPTSLTNVNGTLFFSANDPTNGNELWMSDGTAAGTTLVKDIYPGGFTGYYGGYYPNKSYPSNLTNVNGTLFFTAQDGTNGRELWKSDGTAAGTSLVKDIDPGYHIEYYYDWYGRQSRSVANGSYPGSLTNVNGTLFFTANDGTGTKLWQSDGSEAGTVLVANLVASGLTNVNGTLFFSADDGVHGAELWKLTPPSADPDVSIGDVTVTEGNTGTRAATFTVILSAPSSQAVTVAYATAAGTAAAGSDYQSVSGTLTIPAGQTTGTITVLVNGERLGEPNETFFVNLSSPTNATIADGQGVGTIVDDEPTMSLSDASPVLEGNSGTTAMSFILTLSAAYDVDVTVDFTTQDGSATTADNDYQSASGAATIVAGSTTAAIVIHVNGDEKAESDETLSVVLSNAAGARITDGQASGAIRNDDSATKFYVVDSASDKTFEYAAAGAAVENYRLRSGNNDPRGAASYAAGDRVWVIDNDDYVYVYDAAGTALGYWKAKGLSTPEGIASNGTDLWIVDRGRDRVYRFAGAASRTSGSASPTSSFALNSGNRDAKGIETDGTHLWVVNDASTNQVFKYTLAGALVGSWTISGANTTPTGITLDPTNPSDIWIVDSGTDRVYQYTAAASRTSGSQSAAASFALAVGNTNPQGIADPPAVSSAISDAPVERKASPVGSREVRIAGGQVKHVSSSGMPLGQDQLRLAGVLREWLSATTRSANRPAGSGVAPRNVLDARTLHGDNSRDVPRSAMRADRFDFDSVERLANLKDEAFLTDLDWLTAG